MELLSHEDGIGQTDQEGTVTEIVTLLEDKRDTAISNRVETEARWLRDLQQFEGNTIDRMTKGATDHFSAVRKSPPVVHITRTRTLAIAARIINMLVPSNERSWNIEPTPVPTMIKALKDNTPVMDPSTGREAMIPDESAPAPEPAPPGQPEPDKPQRPVTKADLARKEIEDAEKRSDKMRKRMDDQLVECRFNAEQRKAIVDGCKIGTGIIEGPVVAGSFKKARYQVGDMWVVRMEEEPAPEYKCIDPWNFYPMPAESITSCDGVFIDQLMTRKELQELRLLPGFDKDMIREILLEDPEHSEKYSNSLVSRANITGETVPTDTRYSVWKYTGTLDGDDLEQLGIDVDEELDIVDPIVEAWFCNTRLMKIKRHALEGGFRLPYYVWNYEESETSMFGYGVPYFMRDSDRVIQSTWHMILHNSAISAGPMLVRHKGAIEPANGSEEITGGLKQWFFTSDEGTIKDAFELFHIDARIEELTAVHELARKNADEELAFPALAQGEPTEAVKTSSGLAMLMNASNVVQRRIAQSYDDDILEPAIVALYDYNMIYLEDNDSKGDMKVKPMGATKLVVKDMQTQHLLVIADITTNDRFAPYMKDDKLLRAILKAAEVDVDELMKSDDEMQDKGPSPKEQLDAAEQKAKTKKLLAEAAKLERDVQQVAPGPQPMTDTEYSELQLSYDKLETSLKEMELRHNIAVMDLSKTEGISLAEIDSRFNISERTNENRLMIKEIEERRRQLTDGYMARLKAEEIAQKALNLKKGFDTYG